MKHNATFFGIALVAVFAGAASGIAPKMLPLVIGLFLAFAVARARIEKTNILCSADDGLLTLSALAFSGYVGLSSLWSTNFVAAEKAAMLALVILAGCHAHKLTIAKKQLDTVGKNMIIGLIVGLLYIFAIIYYSKFYNVISMFNMTITKLPDHYLNKHVVSIVLLLWPTLFIIKSICEQKTLRILNFILLGGATITAAFLSSSETAKFAVIAGGVGFTLAWKMPKNIYQIARGLWMVVIIGIIPLVMVLDSTGMKENTIIPISARDRIYIWNHTAKVALKNPILGIGVRSSRYNKNEAGRFKKDGETALLKSRLGWHSHNIFLQTWLELGAVGAGFILVIGLLILRNIRALETGMKPYAYAGFSTFSAVASVGYGMWQSWLMASLGCMIVFFLIALKPSLGNPNNIVRGKYI